MSIWHAIILGIIQGFTEFLPISSSGHLLLIEYIFGIEEGNLFFNILLHIASLLAVIIVLRKEIMELIKKPFSNKVGTIMTSCITTIIVVLLLSSSTDKFTSVGYLGFGFLVSAVLILITHIKSNYKNKKLIKTNISYIDSLIIGVSQGLATLPGISRSGTTMCTALLLGNERKESANFSFLISIPIIIGAIFFDVIKSGGESIGSVSAINCILGFVSSFVVALLSIKLMYKVIKDGKWVGFSIYLFILSVMVILNQYVFMWI